MNLSKKPTTIQWPDTHYIYVKKKGPFQETAQRAWGELHAQMASVSSQAKPLGFMTLYQMEPEMVYLAGVVTEGKPAALPAGLKYMKFEGGKYAKFTLVGPYEDLPEACGLVFEIADEIDLPFRAGFFIEHYVNDPNVTPPAELITEICLPVE